MIYSEVVNNGWVLPKKAKYTLHDINKLMTDSLFGKYGKRTLTKKTASFIVKCSALYWCTDYTKAVSNI